MQNLNKHGCCEGISAETPVKVYNRPGLTAICYRVGDHARFKESLLASLTLSKLPALRNLTTRKDDDFTVALFDAWSSVADILTFYQERIANESYLATATEQFSILQLARLIGYELRPGVAASTYVAFTLESVPGQLLLSPTEKSQAEIPPVTIETGTKVQSTPGPGEKAQTFETIEAIEARPEWNAMQPRISQPQTYFSDNNIIVIYGTANELKAGDIILLHNGLSLKKILKVEIDTDAKTSLLYIKSDATLPSFTEASLTPDGNISDYPDKVELSATIIGELLSKTWKMEDLDTLIEMQGWSGSEVTDGFAAESSSGILEDQISVFRKKAAAFGYNAIKEINYNDSNMPNPPSAWDEWALSANESNNKIYLDSANEQILPGTYVAVQKPGSSIENASVYNITDADSRSRTDYGLSTKTTELTISASQPWWDTSKTDLSAIRSLTLHVQSVPLTLAGCAIDKEITGDTITLTRLYLGLKTGAPVILTGERADIGGIISTELKFLKDIYVYKGLTVLVFDTPLNYPYLRKTVTINANVALATHGETVTEILGSGNAASIFQKFVLKQSPLTYISDSTPTGTASTLEIRVNNVLWHEVPSFFERGPEENIFITRLDDEGNTTVIFGDGINGSRLPTGQENIKATYRKGIGSGGILKANQLSQLMTRPLGVKSAANPLKSSGAQDREALEDARKNAKLTIYTLGRIVSLMDYEDFARAFAGISKALATWTWSGQSRRIYLTVAGIDGAAVEDDSELYDNLSDAIQESGTPGVQVTIASYLPRFFKLKANIRVDSDYDPDIVLEEIEMALREKFSFANREFGQAVAYSEVISIMQQVEGVIAADIDEFYRSDEVPDLKDRLFAAVPAPGTEIASPAEILTIDPGPINLNIIV
jgi:hypothetical protein